MNCLVTGGAGFIGSHLVDALVRRGDAVRVVDNLSTGDRGNLAEHEGKIDVLVGDLCDPDFARQAVADMEVIFHEAALPSVPLSIEQPLSTHHHCVTSSMQLLHAAQKAKVRRLVYAASSSAYGERKEEVKHEHLLPAPISPYAAAKLAVEYYCQAFSQAYELETVSLRYFNVFGPRQNPDSPYSAVIPIFVTLMLRGEPPVIYGDGTQSRDFTYVENVVAGNLLAAEAKGVSGRVFNVAMGDSHTLLELMDRLNELLGISIEPQFAPPRPGDVKHSLADIGAAKQALGYEPHVDFEEGLNRSIAYYRKCRGG